MATASSKTTSVPSQRQPQFAHLETRFVELMTELFQLDEAEALDFGLYRIIRRHNREVRAFLGEIVVDKETRALRGGRLAELLDTTFASIDHEAQAGDKLRLKELEKDLGLKPGMTQEQRETLLAQAESIPAIKVLVAEYRSCSETLGLQQTVQQDRAEVLNRLYQFFSRHYQDGDFIVERRYGKGGARYVKSTGEDTEFHWATEDMYYIKSGDIFTDFPVRLANGQRLLFTVEPESLQATRAALKPNDKAHYELDAATKNGEVIRLRLKYVKNAQTEKQKDDIVAAAQKVGAGGTAENAADIRRWLGRFMARNQSDFFIHKRLKEALSDDLDIFIKTDVLDVDQLLAGAMQQTDLPKRAMKVARIVRDIGGHIIEFLAALEEFQKALWEKKKLVFETRYVITLDRLERHCPEWLAKNIALIVKQQRKEWAELGLGDYAKAAACIRKIPGDLATPASEHYLPLPVDTRNFDAAFKWSLLEAVTAATSLEEALDGVVIHSDNWQALNTIQTKYRERIKCCYIDPPYNTGTDGFPYKDAYQHASWMAMIVTRLQVVSPMLNRLGVLFSSIDAVEQLGLRLALDHSLGARNRVEEIIWAQSFTKNQSPTYSTNHEYVHVYAANLDAAKADSALFRINKPGAKELLVAIDEINPQYPSIAEVEQRIARVMGELDEKFRQGLEEAGIEWSEELQSRSPYKGIKNYRRAEYRDELGSFVPEGQAKNKKAKIWVWYPTDSSMPAGKQADSTRDPSDPNYRFYSIKHAVSGKACDPPTRGWAWPFKKNPDEPNRPSFEEKLADQRIAWGKDESVGVLQKTFLNETLSQPAPSVLNEFSRGDKQLASLFGKEWNQGAFPNPKPSKLICNFIHQSSGESEIVLDFFGGSGSTWHGALDAQALDGYKRKTILVESASHFELVLLKRLKKISASSDWGKRGSGTKKTGKDGQANSIDGLGVFLRAQHFEQYDDTLENLDTEIKDGESGDLLFENAAFALRYRLNKVSRALYSGVERFTSPFGYNLKRAEGGGEASSCEVDLVESLPYLLGMDVTRLYREPAGVVMLGRNRRSQSVAIFFRDSAAKDSAQWVADKLAQHPADRVYTNDPASLSFEGCDRFEAIEAVFALQFGRN